MKNIYFVLLSILFFPILNSCINSNPKELNEKNNIEKSSFFQEELRINNFDSALTNKSIIKLLSTIGEHDFLNSSKYNFYIIAFTKSYEVSKRVFVIKKDSHNVFITYKDGETLDERNVNNPTNNNDFLTIFKSKQINATLRNDTIFKGIRSKLDSLISKIEPANIDDYNDAESIILYYNGMNYYYFSYHTLQFDNYIKMEQVIFSIKNTECFRSLLGINHVLYPY